MAKKEITTMTLREAIDIMNSVAAYVFDEEPYTKHTREEVQDARRITNEFFGIAGNLLSPDTEWEVIDQPETYLQRIGRTQRLPKIDGLLGSKKKYEAPQITFMGNLRRSKDNE